MDEDIFVEKKKLSPAALTAIIAGGVVVIAVIALVVYFAFFRAGTLFDDWHDEEEVVQYTFYKDNKMIVDTPYGDYIGKYVYDQETGKGIISMEGGTIEFTFEKDKVVLSNGGILKRGKINVVHLTVPPQVTTEATTTPPETTPAVTATETTVAATTVAETTAAATTAAATTTVAPTTVAPTTVAETTPTTTAVSFPTFTFIPFYPSLSYIVGTPIVGQWTDEDTGLWLIDFSDDGTCTVTWGTWSYGTTDYEYNIFTGEGSMTLSTIDYELSVSGDELIVTPSGVTGGQLFNRVT